MRARWMASSSVTVLTSPRASAKSSSYASIAAASTDPNVGSTTASSGFTGAAWRLRRRRSVRSVRSRCWSISRSSFVSASALRLLTVVTRRLAASRRRGGSSLMRLSSQSSSTSASRLSFDARAMRRRRFCVLPPMSYSTSSMARSHERSRRMATRMSCRASESSTSPRRRLASSIASIMPNATRRAPRAAGSVTRSRSFASI
jgi:hypothetical protein